MYTLNKNRTCRFSRGMLSFGLSFTSSGLPGGNDYLNLALLGLSGIPASLFCFIFMDKIGRRYFSFIFASLSGISLIVATFLPTGTYFQDTFRVYVMPFY